MRSSHTYPLYHKCFDFSILFKIYVKYLQNLYKFLYTIVFLCVIMYNRLKVCNSCLIY